MVSALLQKRNLAATCLRGHTAIMDNFFEQIGARQSAIKSEIDELNLEARLWEMAGHLYFQRHLVVSGDMVTRRTAHKFAVLGQVAKYLTKNANIRQRGASTTDIYRQIKRYFPTMSPSTFRSQLTRFKKEGRLVYDENEGTWSLAKRKEVAP